MSLSKDTSSSNGKVHEPPQKKPKVMISEADRAEIYLSPAQPGRMHPSEIYWRAANRGGQGIMPLHAQDVAVDICVKRTSKRRYNCVRLVEVPESAVKSWLSAIHKKIKQNPLLATFQAMRHAGPLYATLNCTHFVGAHRLILEGGRRYKGQPDGQRFRLREDDIEGGLIQSQGVLASVYSAKLWDDPAALLAIMREDNLDAEINMRETELDAFGTVSLVVSDLSAGFEQAGKEVTAAEVMAAVEELGYGDMAKEDWLHLVTFRLFLGQAHADMLLDCLFQVCNGRVKTAAKTYTEIHKLHPKGHAWPKVFLLVETYCGELLDAEKGQHRVFKHVGPEPKVLKTLDVKAIKLLSYEKENAD